MAKNKWEIFEKFVNKILKDLTSDTLVQTDQSLQGERTKQSRKVDILIQRPVGNYCINIAIECKDFKSPVNVASVEETIELFHDVGVNMGVIVAANGFTSAAQTVGERAGLKLYNLTDTDNHNWKASLKIPTLCYVKNLKKFNFSITYPRTNLIQAKNSYMLYDNQGEQLGFIQDLIVAWWTQADHGVATGVHKNIDVIPQEKFLLVNQELIPIKVKANIHVEELAYLKEWSIEEISEFEEQENEEIKKKNFMTETVHFEDLKNNWRKVKGTFSLFIRPVIRANVRTFNNP